MVPDAFLTKLRARFPSGQLTTDEAALAAYESDALTAYRARPGAVVLAESNGDVVDAVRICHECKAPFVARGSGTSLSGGSQPIAGGLVLGLSRMNRVLQYNPHDRMIVVQPGVVTQHVSNLAAADGLYYAPDPSSAPVCTIGGNVAFNSGGAHCLKNGMTANHVLAAKVVTPEGEIVWLGQQSHEPCGADLAGAFVGSEGLLGIAVEITLRLMPRPERYHTVLAAYDSLELAGEAVASIVASGLLPGAIEIMDRLAIEASEAAVGAGFPDAAAVLIIELEGPSVDIDQQIPILDAVVAKSGATEVRVAQNADERALIWTGRKCAFSAVGRLSLDYIVQDGVVPRTRLSEALVEVMRLGAEFGLRVANVFHAGDGNLHPMILYDGRNDGELHRAEQLAGEILRVCLRMGGSITGEHGVGVEKIDYLPEMYDETSMAVMRRVRRSLDPLELANRGKMLAAEAAANRGATLVTR